MPKVYLVQPDHSITKMFFAYKFNIVPDPDDADFLQFTGGADVHPSFYKDSLHPATSYDLKRDVYEAGIYNRYVGKKPFAGICRGGQFLNVMNGGKMWQHVNNHAIYGTHEAYDVRKGEALEVTSTHHQMMIPTNLAKILLISNRSTFKQSGKTDTNGEVDNDIEAVWYPDTKSLCYQPHPEFVNKDHECCVRYFEYLKEFVLE